MSKLVKLLDQSLKTDSEPMGFNLTRTASTRMKILLIANITQAASEHIINNITGVDAIFFSTTKWGPDEDSYGKTSRVSLTVPFGYRLGHIEEKDVKRLEKAGCDFVVFPAVDTSFAILQSCKMGRILEIEPSIDDRLLQSVNNLPLDAVLVANDEKKHILTWRHLMLYQHFATLLKKSLLVPVPSSLTEKELQLLWKSGVTCVVMNVGERLPVGGLMKLRKMIDKTNFSLKRTQGRMKPSIPYINSGISRLADEQGGED